jgi:hypothetical protein
MTAAAQQGRDPFQEAVRLQERLFTTKPIFLGVEECLRHPEVPCGLRTDAERARHVRKRIREFLNSRGEWELMREPVLQPLHAIVTLAEDWRAAFAQSFRDNSNKSQANVPTPESDSELAHASLADSPTGSNGAPTLVPVLSVQRALEKIGNGTLCILSEDKPGRRYGRAMIIADQLAGDRVLLAKWVRRLVNWNGRQAPIKLWQDKILPMVQEKLALQKTPVIRVRHQDHRILALVSIAELSMRVPVDSHGVPLWRPLEREVLPMDCARCSLVSNCRQLSSATGTAMLWRRLRLVNEAGVPTLRGRVVSFFSQGDGLAIAAALEDETYSLEELIYDLANLDGGFRFCGQDNRWAGRLAVVCHAQFGLQSVPGYLENGVSPKYGAGAEQVVASVHRDLSQKHTWITDILGAGDIDRIIIEWRSLLRQISHAPDLDWPRWRALQRLAKTTLNETESPTLTDLPALEYDQTRRVDHRLMLKRH